MKLVVLGLNHRSAAVEVRERFSFDKDEVVSALNRLYEFDCISECVILSTCNRTEIYAALEGVEFPKDYMLAVLKDLKGADHIDADAFFFYEERDCIEHLFRVSASLDSLVLGEGQILSQLKGAYIQAYSAGCTGTIFNILFQRAISVGKKVRTNTGIANTPVSVSYTAVNLAEDSLDKPLSEATVLILGAGTMSELTATHLQAKGVKTIFVSNRTFAKAEMLAERFNGKAVKLDNFVDYAKDADILITSTGAPHYIITEREAKKITTLRKGEPIVMIDIAVPRDIDPTVADLDGIYLFNIDSLESVVEENKAQREEEARRAEPIIHDAIEELLDKLSYLTVRPMMALLTEKAERIRRRELHRALAKLPDISDKERRVMDSMSRMIIRKMLREPMIHFNGTRKSALALWQAEHISAELQRLYPNITVELVHFNTKGDRILEKPLAQVGGKGLFTAELEEAMHAGNIDIAVHSLKDMPTELPEGLTLGAISAREVPYDALVSPVYKTLDKLPQGARVGTSSLRRQAQLLHVRPDLKVEVIRGNVQTRLSKIETEKLDGVILAQAGLKRLGLEDQITQVFKADEMIPAVGQGALAIECRADDTEMLEILAPINDEATRYAVEGERSFLRQLNGGCQVPMGVHGTINKGQLTLKAMIASLDGKTVYEGEISGPAKKGEILGKNLAKALYEEGGKRIVDALIEEGIIK